MKRRILFFLLFVCGLTMNAQTFEGIVTDAYGLPLQDVHILHEKSQLHTHSNAQGKFVVAACEIGDTLYFTNLGYQSTNIVVKSFDVPVIVVMAEQAIDLDAMVVYPRLDALNVVAKIDMQTDPVNSSQDILRKVPGLFIGQHAGGGKAEQIFLRGFDIDHGTDVNITMDGMPVNMVSHAHGQGYADLHFIIPEVVEQIDFGKGPYNLDKGNFATAGYVAFKSKDRLENSSLRLEAGMFDTYRMLGLFNIVNNNKQSAYIATEFLGSNGPFDSPQLFSRVNLFAKYSGLISNADRIEVSISHFESKWDASGQIPERSVNDGSISRFGAIDDTEGGNTSRSNLAISLDKVVDDNTSMKNTVFVSAYDFELYSNFTFFLEDELNGDQIRQKEKRTIYGLSSEVTHTYSLGGLNSVLKAGLQFRADQSRGNELSNTLYRSITLQERRKGDIDEYNFGAFIGTDVTIGKWLINPALRADVFNFQYEDDLFGTYERNEEADFAFSPKLNIAYNHSPALQLYLKTGKGFHSNDTRAAVNVIGDTEPLPAAYGADLGALWKPTSDMLLNVAAWYLFLEDELVYVGDAGIVEPSGKTRRLGVDLSYRYQPLAWLFWNLDANYAFARSIDEPSSADYIPLAPDFTLASGISAKHKSGLYGGVQVRHLGDRPANEDNSIVAKGYTVTDLHLGYQWGKLDIGFQIENLFDQEWNEAQFATESRLQGELQPIEEIHFTPGTPFFIKGIVQYNF